jgi:hypothetical protein
MNKLNTVWTNNCCIAPQAQVIIIIIIIKVKFTLFISNTLWMPVGAETKLRALLNSALDGG